MTDLNKQEPVALRLGRWPCGSLCFIFPAYTDTGHMFLFFTTHAHEEDPSWFPLSLCDSPSCPVITESPFLGPLCTSTENLRQLRFSFSELLPVPPGIWIWVPATALDPAEIPPTQTLAALGQFAGLGSHRAHLHHLAGECHRCAQKPAHGLGCPSRALCSLWSVELSSGHIGIFFKVPLVH